MKDEALKLALEAAYLAGFNASGEGYNGEYGIDCPEENAIWKRDRDNDISAIKQAIAAPVQEPVYHLRQFGDVTKEQLDRYMATGDINPQKDLQKKREFVGLTDEEIREFDVDPIEAKLMIAKLKEKNT